MQRLSINTRATNQVPTIEISNLTPLNQNIEWVFMTGILLQFMQLLSTIGY